MWFIIKKRNVNVSVHQTHVWDSATPMEETIRTMDDLVRCGKIRYAGASNLNGWQIQQLVGMSEKMGLNPFVSLQVNSVIILIRN